MAPRDGEHARGADAARRSRAARRQATRARAGRAVLAEMEADFDERRFIKRELSRALATRSFEVHYQPIVKADGGAIVGVEALLRWNHPSPRLSFRRRCSCAVAEEAGLMDQLGEFVLRRALADAARWPDLYVAVNLSPVQVRDRKFVDLVAAVLPRARPIPPRVVLEITEGVLIDDPETAKARLEDLRALGVRLALDDFGSGYSSLTYLQQLAVRQAQDRPRLRRGARPLGQYRRDHPGHRRARARARHERADRGRGDRGAAGAVAARGLQRDAGFSCSPSRRRARRSTGMLAQRRSGRRRPLPGAG